MNKKNLLTASIFIFLAVFLYQSLPVLTPFIIAAIIAYIVRPLDSWLTGKIGRGLSAAVLVFSIIILIMMIPLFFVPFAITEIRKFSEVLSMRFSDMELVFWNWIDFLGFAGNKQDIMQTLSGSSQQITQISISTMTTFMNSMLSFLGFVSMVIITPIVAFYVLKDWGELTENSIFFFPKSWRPKTLSLITRIDEKLSALLRGQFMVMMFLSAFYSIGFTLVGLQLGLLIGVIAGLLSFIPYVGIMIGVGLAYLIALIQFQNTAIDPYLWLAAVFAIGQFIEGNILTPRIVGDKIGMRPVTVIFALIIGSHFGGLAGMLFALPIATALSVLLPELIGYWHFLVDGNRDDSVTSREKNLNQKEPRPLTAPKPRRKKT